MKSHKFVENIRNKNCVQYSVGYREGYFLDLIHEFLLFWFKMRILSNYDDMVLSS